MTETIRFRRDRLERAVATMFQVVLGYLTAEGVVALFDMDATYKAFILPVVATGLSILKAEVAKRVGNPDSASLDKEI